MSDLSATALAAMFEFNNKLYINGIFELDDDTARKRISDNANPIIWLAGHLTMTRTHILELVGSDRAENPWYKLFRKAYDPEVEYPGLAEIKKFWGTVSDPMIEKMRELTPGEMARDIGYDLPHQRRDLAGGLVFWIYHESWHLGQIAYIRKCLGMEGLVPY